MRSHPTPLGSSLAIQEKPVRIWWEANRETPARVVRKPVNPAQVSYNRCGPGKVHLLSGLWGSQL